MSVILYGVNIVKKYNNRHSNKSAKKFNKTNFELFCLVRILSCKTIKQGYKKVRTLKSLLKKNTRGTGGSFQIQFREVITRYLTLIQSLYYCIKTELKGSSFQSNKIKPVKRLY